MRAFALLAAAAFVIWASLGVFSGAAQPGSDGFQLPPVGDSGTKLPKIESALAEYWLAQVDTFGAAGAVARQEVPLVDGLVHVEIDAVPGREDEVRAAVGGLGGRVHLSWENLVEALVPPQALMSLAEHDAVRFVRRPSFVEPMAVTSEGVSLSGVSQWHAAGIRGAGAKVAVIDLGFYGYEALLGTELPPASRVIYRNFAPQRSTGRHGTAVAEIIYDIAPEAQLALLEADTVLQVLSALEFAKGNGYTIVNMSFRVSSIP